MENVLRRDLVAWVFGTQILSEARNNAQPFVSLHLAFCLRGPCNGCLSTDMPVFALEGERDEATQHRLRVEKREAGCAA